MYAMNMDPNTWKSPFEFRPERFLDSKLNVINAHKLIPFGAGLYIIPFTKWVLNAVSHFFTFKSFSVNPKQNNIFSTTGRRVCFGESLANASLFTFLVTLLQKFTFKVSPDHPMPTMKPVVNGVSLSPAPFHCLVQERYC